jgi:hypothetical protein
VPRPVEESLPGRPAYFWWLLANLLAICFAVLTWSFCLHIFGNPEIPRNYAILSKLKRLPVLKRYSLTDVPAGNALASKELYKRYYGYSDAQRIKINALLMRNYLTNFDRALLLTYVEGDFQVTQSRALGGKDFFSPGIALRLQALVKPDDFTKAVPYPVFVEMLLPTAQTSISYKPGDLLSLKKSPHCGAVIHVSKISHEGETALLLTAVPIAYGPYQLGNSGFMKLEPPERLRPDASFPAFK